MSTEAPRVIPGIITETPRVIPGHEHSRIDLHRGQLVLIWPDDMDVETFLFVEHMLDTILFEKRRQLKILGEPTLGQQKFSPPHKH